MTWFWTRIICVAISYVQLKLVQKLKGSKKMQKIRYPQNQGTHLVFCGRRLVGLFPSPSLGRKFGLGFWWVWGQPWNATGLGGRERRPWGEDGVGW